MNPFENLHSQLLFIDSNDKLPGQNNCDFTVNLGSADRIQQTKKIALVSSAIPNLFDNVSQYTNLMVWESSPGVFESYAIPVGQYTLTTLLNAMLSCPNVTAVTFPNGRVVIETGAVSVRWSKENSTVAPTIGWTDTVTDFGTSYTAPSLPNLSGVEQVFVHVTPVATNNMVTSNKQKVPVLYTASMQGTEFGRWQLTESQSHVLHQITFDTFVNLDNQFRVRITDRFSRTLFLPDNWNISFVLKCWVRH
jgi:hypothetical protein